MSYMVYTSGLCGHLGGRREDLAVAAERRAGGLRLAWRLDDGDAHEPQQLLRLLVLLPGDLHGRLKAREEGEL